MNFLAPDYHMLTKDFIDSYNLQEGAIAKFAMLQKLGSSLHINTQLERGKYISFFLTFFFFDSIAYEVLRSPRVKQYSEAMSSGRTMFETHLRHLERPDPLAHLATTDTTWDNVWNRLQPYSTCRMDAESYSKCIRDKVLCPRKIMFHCSP